MDFEKDTKTFPSANGLYQVQYCIYRPSGKPRALIQLVHGMAEYLERYEEYIENYTRQGFLVFGTTHIGHKGSVDTDEHLGYFGAKDGWKAMVEDEKTLTKFMTGAYPDTPVFLYGHSMGSFISRAYLAQNSEVFTGAIICGTAGSNPLLWLAKILTSIVSKEKKSPFINSLMFGNYNAKIENKRTEYDWLSRDPEAVDKYIADPYCGFIFTGAGFRDLVNLLDYATADDWYGRIPADFPIFFIGGAEDPVSSWGKGYEEIDRKMKRTARSDYQMKLYPGMRHEIHNEIGKEEVISDVSEWIIGHLMV